LFVLGFVDVQPEGGFGSGIRLGGYAMGVGYAECMVWVELGEMIVLGSLREGRGVVAD